MQRLWKIKRFSRLFCELKLFNEVMLVIPKKERMTDFER
jgi:hypothetical protein